jgi:hypothetical protein
MQDLVKGAAKAKFLGENQGRESGRSGLLKTFLRSRFESDELMSPLRQKVVSPPLPHVPRVSPIHSPSPNHGAKEVRLVILLLNSNLALISNKADRCPNTTAG